MPCFSLLLFSETILDIIWVFSFIIWQLKASILLFLGFSITQLCLDIILLCRIWFDLIISVSTHSNLVSLPVQKTVEHSLLNIYLFSLSVILLSNCTSWYRSIFIFLVVEFALLFYPFQFIIFWRLQIIILSFSS